MLEQTQLTPTVQGMIPNVFLNVLTSRTYKGPTGDLQGTNGKNDNLTTKLHFESNSPYITYLFQYFTGEVNISKSDMGSCTGRVQNLVAGRLRDQIIGHSRDVHGTSVNQTF